MRRYQDSQVLVEEAGHAALQRDPPNEVLRSRPCIACSISAVEYQRHALPDPAHEQFRVAARVLLIVHGADGDGSTAYASFYPNAESYEFLVLQEVCAAT